MTSSFRFLLTLTALLLIASALPSISRISAKQDNDFTIVIDPSSVVLRQGESAALTVTIHKDNPSDQIRLIIDLPASLAIDIDDGGDDLDKIPLSVNALADTSIGAYTIRVIGMNGNITH